MRLLRSENILKMYLQILRRNLAINLREKVRRIDVLVKWNNLLLCSFLSFFLQVAGLSLALAILKHQKTRRLWITCKAYPFVSSLAVNNKSPLHNPHVYTLIPASFVTSVTLDPMVALAIWSKDRSCLKFIILAIWKHKTLVFSWYTHGHFRKYNWIVI